MMRFVCTVILVATLCLVSDAEEDHLAVPTNANELLARAVESVEKIASLAFEYERLAQAGSVAESDKLAKRDNQGYAVEAFIRMWWDARKLYRLEVKEWQPEGNRRFMGGEVYDHYVYTVDGEFYRGASDVTKRGKILPQVGLTSSYLSPLMFLGYNMHGLNTHLCRYLRESADVAPTIVLLPDGRPSVSAEYDPPDGSYRRSVTVVFDPAQEYLPVEVVSRFLWCNTLDQEFTVTKTEVVSGVRIPTGGRAAAYYINEIYPDGLTNGDINAMAKEHYLKNIEPRVKREAALVGPPAVIAFDSAKMTVNEFYPLSYFQLEMPAGFDVVDFSKSRVVSAKPNNGDPAVEPSRSGRPAENRSPVALPRFVFPWIILGFANVVLILGVLGFRAWRRFQFRRLMPK